MLPIPGKRRLALITVASLVLLDAAVMAAYSALLAVALAAGQAAAVAAMVAAVLLTGYRVSRVRRTQLQFLPNLRQLLADLPAPMPMPAPAQAAQQAMPPLSARCYRINPNGNGQSLIADVHGQTIVSHLLVFAQSDRGTELLLLAFRNVEQRSDEWVVRFAAGGDADYRVELRVSPCEPAVHVSATVCFTRDVCIERIALVFVLAVPLREVYRPTGQPVRSPFAPEYWLGCEGGACWGDGPRQFEVQHAPDVCSLQVDTTGQALWVNLESAAEHPYVNVPFVEGRAEPLRDLSPARFRAGDVCRATLALTVGQAPAVRVRVWPHRHGFLSTYVWAEHACHASLATHRAAYFGHSDIRQSCRATGGFVRHRIPVTKSVFVSNRDVVPLVGRSGAGPQPMVAIGNEPAFSDFLDQLQNTELYEICLHCSDCRSSGRADVENALRYMQERFRSVSWIDHLWWRPDVPTAGCREAFSAEGVLPGHTGYIADLWEQYGVRYFWNSTHEYRRFPAEPVHAGGAVSRLALACARIWDRLTREGPHALLSAGRRPFDAPLRAANATGCPLPVCWQHPTVTGSAWSWPSYGAESGTRSGADWNRIYADGALERFAASGFTLINHCYPVWCGDRSGCISWHDADTAAIDASFDAVLARFARFRDAGKIQLTTVKDHLDYHILLKQVRLTSHADGSVIVTNQSAEAIDGFSLLIDSAAVGAVNGTITTRQVPHGVVVSGRLEAGARWSIQTVSTSGAPGDRTAVVTMSDGKAASATAA